MSTIKRIARRGMIKIPENRKKGLSIRCPFGNEKPSNIPRCGKGLVSIPRAVGRDAVLLYF
jgi:hypothetical protein